MVEKTRVQEELIHEYPAIGKYRVRVLQKPSKPAALDVREYVSTDKFEGFTRRGIRLVNAIALKKLHDMIGDAIARGWFDEDWKSDTKGSS